MAETLGSLCDKLTIVKLKEYHSEDKKRLESLQNQCNQLQDEINQYIIDAFDNRIPLEKLSFAPNKVYAQKGNETRTFEGSIAHTFSTLANVNCELWHEQEKVYEFEQVAADEKDAVIKQLAILNLERNQCINLIDEKLKEMISRANV